MPSRMRQIVLALLALAAAIAPLADAQASQTVDACYKRCVMDRQLGSRKFACLRICNASPAKKCQDRCFRKYPNSPRELKSCLGGCGEV